MADDGKKVYTYKSVCMRHVNGKQKLYRNSTVVHYELKLHHPDENELEQIKKELYDGASKKEVAPKHNLSIYRLNKLLKAHNKEKIKPQIYYDLIASN